MSLRLSQTRAAIVFVVLPLFLTTGYLSLVRSSVYAQTPSESPADLLMKEGAKASHRGAFGQALSDWKQAADLYGQEGKRNEQSRALVSAARAAQALGETKQALQHLELALSFAQQSDDSVWLATVLAGIGRTYLAGRQFEAAGQHLAQALELARAHGNPRLLATVLNDVGLLHALQRQDAEALASFTESLRVSQSAEHRLLAIKAGVNAARTAQRLNRPQDSRMWLDQAMDLVRELRLSHDKAVALIDLGLAYQELRLDLPSISDPLLLRAAGLLQEAVAVSGAMRDARTLSYALGYLGRLYEREHRSEEALQLTRRAVFEAQSADAPESLYRWQWQLGRLLASTDRLDDAITAYTQAVATLRPIRPEVVSALAQLSPSGQDSIKPLFFEMADLLLRRASLTEDQASADAYLHGARDAIEAYKAAELRDYFRDECVDALQARIATPDALSPTTAVVYPIIFADRTELLVSLPTGLKRTAVQVSSATLTQEIRSFRRTVEKRTTREYLPHAQQLYDWLIRPLEQDLTALRIHTLVFVPDGALRTIPMAALHDGQRFLIEQYAVALTPGLNLTDPHPLNRDTIRFLASGLTKAVQGFPALPYVADELTAIRTLYRGDQLLNDDFKSIRLERELREGQFGILHIATHGQFAPDPDQTFLLTFDGKLTLSQLDQLVGLFRFRQDPLELLTLSACQTGVGDDRAALGLAGVAVKAGARSALATLWFINDEASAALVSEFYRQLRNPSLSKAMALRAAQVKLLQDRIYEHPAYWSPFLLLNNWL